MHKKDLAKRTQNFLSKANVLHQGKYLYDKVQYLGGERKIIITCPIHGDFTITPHAHLKGQGCPYCSGHLMRAEDFINKSKAVHHNKYDYSKVNYVNLSSKVVIHCPIHGDFVQMPSKHLKGCGCIKCGHIVTRTKPFGVGYNSSNECEPANSKSYRIWRLMLERCYGNRLSNKAYIGCCVCEEWHDFANFKEWFNNNYIEGWQLDKDILVKGNKVYSPDTCCFVPQEINTFFTSCRVRRGSYPLGVSFVKSKNKFVATLSIDNKNKTLGHFDNCDEAFEVYKHAKEQQLLVIANRWRDKLPDNVYKALVNYKISKND